MDVVQPLKGKFPHDAHEAKSSPSDFKAASTLAIQLSGLVPPRNTALLYKSQLTGTLSTTIVVVVDLRLVVTWDGEFLNDSLNSRFGGMSVCIEDRHPLSFSLHARGNGGRVLVVLVVLLR